MPAPVRQRLAWQTATVTAVIQETRSATTLQLDIPGWDGHLGGQHLDIRLTADDGYQASRSYSLSSGPHDAPQVTVERVDDGEVSPYLAQAVEVDDKLEVRGPIGGYFIWRPQATGPLLLIGGGSGIAPLRAIWRASTHTAPTVLYSARTRDRIIFSEELAATEGARPNSSPTVNAQVFLTREAEASPHRTGRITLEDVKEALRNAVRTGATPANDRSKAVSSFVCGPTAFVEAMAQHLLAAGAAPPSIRTERFG